jgi:hypothetical protein
MRKVSTTAKHSEIDGMRAEYDFVGGVRGKHYRAMQAGYTVTIHQADGKTVNARVQTEGRSRNLRTGCAGVLSRLGFR